jgi:drug/metabolite transporter (DMT)-like permease
LHDSAHKQSVGLLLLVALSWSAGGVLFKLVDWPPLATASGRGLIAALFLIAVRGRALRFTWSPLQIGAALAYASCTVMFAAANKLTTAANAILLQYTAPIWVALLGAWLLNERARRSDWITIAVTFLGMAIFLYEGLRLNDLLGILLAIGSGVGFGAMTVLLRKQKDASPLESIVLGNLIGAIIGIPAMLSAGAPTDATSIIAIFALGIFQLGLPYLIYSYAIKHVTALEAVLIPIIEPILNPFWVMLIIGERPTGLALLGGAIVIGAVFVRAVMSVRERRATLR